MNSITDIYRVLFVLMDELVHRLLTSHFFSFGLCNEMS
jgi:hypothetical protein